MSAKNQIGLEPTQVGKRDEQLNDLLANYQMFYMNVRGFHWNIMYSSFPGKK